MVRRRVLPSPGSRKGKIGNFPKCSLWQLAGKPNTPCLPIDQRGADLRFHVISARHAQGSIVLTTNKPYKHWSAIFNGNSTITSAVFDRLLNHSEAVLIEGASYCIKDLPKP
jgi:hypothetical protein